MKCIKVTEFAPPPGKEYDALAYPGQGLFIHPTTKQLICVSAPAFTTAYCASMVGIGSLNHLLEDFPEAVYPAPPAPTFSEDFMLKALAIAQQPQLAVNLLVKPA